LSKRERPANLITDDIIREAGLEPPRTGEDIPAYIIQASLKSPKIVRRRVIETPQVDYTVRMRVNQKGVGAVSLYETNHVYGDLRIKVGEIDTYGLQHAEDMFEKVVRAVAKETGVGGIPAKQPKAEIPRPEERRERSDIPAAEKLAAQYLTRGASREKELQRKMEASVEELEALAREQARRAYEQRKREAEERAKRLGGL